MVLLALCLSLTFVWQIAQKDYTPRGVAITYAEFVSLVEREQVVQAHLRGRHVYAVLTQPTTLGPDMQLSQTVQTWMPSDQQETLLRLLRRYSVTVSIGP